MRAKIWLAHQLVARRAVLVLTVLLGLAYPLTMTAVAQIPGLRNQALGSIAHRLDGTPVGSTLIGSSSPTPTEIPSPGTSRPGRRPRATATTRPPARRATSAPRTWSTPCPAIPRTRPRGKQSLLTQWSKEVGTLEGVDGSRPFCTPDGVGAVLGVVRSGGPDRTGHPGGQPRPGLPGGFLPHYLLGRCRGVRDTWHRLHQGVGTSVRGSGPAQPVVPCPGWTV